MTSVRDVQIISQTALVASHLGSAREICVPAATSGAGVSPILGVTCMAQRLRQC